MADSVHDRYLFGLLAAIEVLAVLFGGWSGFEGSGGDWGKVPPTLPVMIFALVYHDLAPVWCRCSHCSSGKQ